MMRELTRVEANEMLGLVEFSVCSVLEEVEPEYRTMLVCLRELRQLLEDRKRDDEGRLGRCGLAGKVDGQSVKGPDDVDCDYRGSGRRA